MDEELEEDYDEEEEEEGDEEGEGEGEGEEDDDEVGAMQLAAGRTPFSSCCTHRFHRGFMLDSNVAYLGGLMVEDGLGIVK